jgi:hypothetical protein
MMRSFRWRWAGSGAVAWLALTVMGMLSPAEARAGCDHPWVKRADLSGILNHLVVLEPSHRLEAPDSELPRPQRRSPCAGGACSRTPEMPVSSTDPPPSRIEFWSDLPAGARTIVPLSDQLAPDRDGRRPARIHTLIERPPRSSSSI